MRPTVAFRTTPPHTAAEEGPSAAAVPCRPCHVPPVPVLTEAEGLTGAPEGTGGIAASEPAGTLQLVAGGAAETGVPAGVQAADRDLPESRPCREGAAQQVGWGQVAALWGGMINPPGTPAPSFSAPPEHLGAAGLGDTPPMADSNDAK